MIRPDRHTNLDLSLINISSFLLSELKVKKEITYDKLLAKVTGSLGKETKDVYPYALNFLFLLGKISYQQQTDTFIYHEA